MNSSYHITFDSGFIMVVEDSAIEALMLQKFLESNNLKVIVFHNADAALDAIRINAPTMIISDVLMPGMDGYEFCSKVKADPVLRDIPVILLTSLGDPMDIINGLQAGADNFITKPYDPKYLLSRMHYLSANRDLRSAGAAEMILEVVFLGKRFTINSERKQILDLLLSVYEEAVKKQDQLINIQSRLHLLNEELLKKNDELESFAHTVSHDLRNPLHAIQGFSEILKEEYGALLPEEGLQYLNMIINASDSMGQLIDDLLQFSKSGSEDIKRSETNLSEIAELILHDLQFRNPERKVKIFIKPDMRAYADTNLMTIVLTNLLGNAWKYSSKMVVAEISFDSIERDGDTVFFIKDNGAGFDNSKAEVIFNPFSRLHSAEDYPGTGIGLSTVRRIIERHGGKIWAVSSINQGATFLFSVPGRVFHGKIVKIHP